jgi:hypothetical protein
MFASFTALPTQIKIALLNLFLVTCMPRLIKYSNPILPPQYCLLRPLCLHLSLPSRRRRPSRDALYARNKNIKQMRSHRGIQNLYLGSEPRKFLFHFLHISEKMFIYWSETGHNPFLLHYCHKTEVYTSEVNTEVLIYIFLLYWATKELIDSIWYDIFANCNWVATRWQ